MRKFVLVALCATLAAPALAKPPLRQVSQIDDGLMYVAIADEIRKRCDTISARMVKAMSTLQGLKSQASAMGYSDKEIKAYVSSDSEKARMRAKATSYLASKGVEAKNTKALCGFGKSEIAKATPIGQLLR